MALKVSNKVDVIFVFNFLFYWMYSIYTIHIFTIHIWISQGLWWDKNHIKILFNHKPWEILFITYIITF